ncbi:camp-dependent protein kinase catalytic subunit [Rhizophlyctis rosea]|uniref:cAMP-dependent protein kinase n=1 Tax=Rhizophlyctis rosea TaxID=64517 RepID=A0AAD5S5C3_9FUNG|nr:camp-dependent protein kinase catalytic subunit [Rhizophlyctis rosea]
MLDLQRPANASSLPSNPPAEDADSEQTGSTSELSLKDRLRGLRITRKPTIQDSKDRNPNSAGESPGLATSLPPLASSTTPTAEVRFADMSEGGDRPGSAGLKRGMGSSPSLAGDTSKLGGLKSSLSGFLTGRTKSQSSNMDRNPTPAGAELASSVLARQRSAKLKKTHLTASMPSGIGGEKTLPQHPNQLGSLEDNGSDTGSSEAFDQVPELQLKSYASAMTMPTAGLNTSPTDSTNPSAENLAPDSSQSSSSQQQQHLTKHKSLPKISHIFGGSKTSSSQQPPSAASSSRKHARAASAVPTDQALAGPSPTPYPLTTSLSVLSMAPTSIRTQAVTVSPLTPGSRKGTLSAYEIRDAFSLPSPIREYHLDDFHVIRRVGKGGFANVFLVRLKAGTGRYFALKAIKKADLVRLKQEKQILNEKNILKAVRHPFVVELYHTFQNVNYLFMTLEFVAGGDLFSYLRKCQRFGEEDAKFYVAEVLIALEYLHSQHVVYRDLKPENILLDTTGHTKLADFGFAKVVRTTTSSFCGTPDYIAVEMVAGRPYTKAVDWWSYGVLIFELVCGKTPFSGESDPPPPLPGQKPQPPSNSTSPDKIYDNIQHNRIKWHPLIRGATKDICKRLLDPNPETRLGSGSVGAGEIKMHPFFKGTVWKKVEGRQTVPPFVPAVDAPEVIERERAARGGRDEHAEALRRGEERVLGGDGFGGKDPFFEMFKDF